MSKVGAFSAKEIMDLLTKRPDLSVADVERLLQQPQQELAQTFESNILVRLWVWMFGGCAHEWSQWGQGRSAAWQARVCIKCRKKQEV